MAAVQQTWGAFKLAGEEIKQNDERIVVAAVETHSGDDPDDDGSLQEVLNGAWQYVPMKMRLNDRVRMVAGL
jgi:hypothetical protein